MFAAFSMISTAINTMMKFRLIRTPSKPVMKSTALTATYALRGIIGLATDDRSWVTCQSCAAVAAPHLSQVTIRSSADRFWCFRQHDCPDDGAQEENPDDFELQQIITEHFHADRVGVALLQHGAGRCIALRAGIRRFEEQREDVERTQHGGNHKVQIRAVKVALLGFEI